MKHTTETDIQRIQRELRELRAEMRANGIRKVSPFNGGLTQAEYRANSNRFRLETELARFTP